MVRKLSIRSALEKERIEEVARLICEGKVAVIPTDTVYGLATNPFREEFVARIFEIKRRGKKPIPLLVSSREYVERVAFLTPQAERLMGRFWPGPLTMVLKRRPETPPIITCESPGVGVRMPAHDVALAIIEKAGGVVTGTSANISGER
ncbi:MAG: threonylcarbamoyl-AMP synthase, partial [Thermoprotei archaeon]